MITVESVVWAALFICVGVVACHVIHDLEPHHYSSSVTVNENNP